jgi:hypothetical protein
MLQQLLILQLDEVDQEGRIHFQQDSTPPHYLEEVREYLNTRFSDQWIGRAALIAWPPLDLFLWGFVKDRVLVPPLPANVAELQTRITAAAAVVTLFLKHPIYYSMDLILLNIVYILSPI